MSDGTRFVYMAKSGDGNIKVGISNSPEQRVKQLNTGNPHNIDLVKTLRTECAEDIERAIHQRFSDDRLDGEWFNPKCADEIAAFIEGCRIVESTNGKVPEQISTEIEDAFRESEIGDERRNVMETVANEFDLPHGVCPMCESLAYQHLDEDNTGEKGQCARCGRYL